MVKTLNTDQTRILLIPLRILRSFINNMRYGIILLYFIETEFKILIIQLFLKLYRQGWSIFLIRTF